MGLLVGLSGIWTEGMLIITEITELKTKKGESYFYLH